MPRSVPTLRRVPAWRAAAAGLLLGAAGLVPVPSALAQPSIADPGSPATDAPRAAASPALSPAVKRLLEAGYLNDAERQDLRIAHGVWLESDLDSPERVALAALVSGDIDNSALKVNAAPAIDRAEAGVLRGEYAEALALLDTIPEDAGALPMRATRIRAQALYELGRIDEAVKVADALLQRFSQTAARSPDDVVEAVRLSVLVTRVRGPAVAGAGLEYHAMMQALDAIRNKTDKLHWRTLIAQAELMYEKDNSPEAAVALQTALALNPSCAQAWAMLGQMSVDGFNFGLTEAIAVRLDMLAQGRSGGAPEAELMARDSSGGVSLWAAIIRARAALRQSDPEAADRALAPALERFPRQRDLLALRCAVEALRYDPPRLERALAEFDRLSPGSPQAHLEVGKALGEARQYEPASEHLAAAHQRLPNWAEPVIELGLLEVQYGRLDPALAALTSAAALDPFNIRASNTLKLVQELQTYASVETEHFTVRYKPGIDEVLAREMGPSLEQLYRVVTGSSGGGIDFEPPVRTYIDLMPDHRWFGVRIAGMPAIHTVAAATGSCIAMEAPREGRDHYGIYDWVRVVRHEFTHTVTLARTHNRIPHWFTEAAAVYLELGPRDFNTCRLLADALDADALFDFDQINIAFVRPQRPTDRQQAYAQGHWMYEFIIRQWGERAPLDLMDLYAQGQREESAFQSVLGVTRAEFLTRFKTWAREQVVAWGLGLPDGTPRVRDLLVQAALDNPETSPKIDEALATLAEHAARAATTGASDDAEAFDFPTPDITAELVNTWLEKYPKHPDVLQLAVRRAMPEDDAKTIDPASAALFERYAEARPVDPLPHQALANLYLNAPDEAQPEKAIPHLEFLDQREQYKTAYAAELARRYAAVKDWDRAWVKAERATQVSPYDAALRELAATVALRRSDFDGAERHVKALVILEPNVARHAERLAAIAKLREQKHP